jgi:hypothetical protein
VIEDLSDHGRLFDHGDDPQRPAAPRTQQRIQLVHRPDQAGPSAPHLWGIFVNPDMTVMEEHVNSE